jgi:hypothetical protein
MEVVKFHVTNNISMVTVRTSEVGGRETNAVKISCFLHVVYRHGIYCRFVV